MRKCGALLSSGYYSSSTSELLKEKESKKVLIQLAPDDLNVTFGEEDKSMPVKQCSDYSLRCTASRSAPLWDVWRYPPKEPPAASSVVTVSAAARPASELSSRTRRDLLDPGVSVTVTPSRPSSPRETPVSIHLSNTGPASSSHGPRPNSRIIRRSRTPQARQDAPATAANTNVSTKSFHLENNPVQSDYAQPQHPH